MPSYHMPPVPRLVVEDRLALGARRSGSRRAAARRASRPGPSPTAGGSHGWCGSGKLIQQNQSSSAPSESSQAIVRSATQSVWYQLARDRVVVHLRRAGVAAAGGVDVAGRVEHRVEHRRPPRDGSPAATARSAAGRRRRASRTRGARSRGAARPCRRPSGRAASPRRARDRFSVKRPNGSRNGSKCALPIERGAVAGVVQHRRRPTARRRAAARRSSTRRACSGTGR